MTITAAPAPRPLARSPVALDPAREWTGAGQVLAIALLLALAGIVARQFDIESTAFQSLLRISAVAYLVHSFLPLRYRLKFFTLLSVGTLLWLFGVQGERWVAACALLGLGLLLIGLCHLPGPLSLRVALLLATGAALVTLRLWQWSEESLQRWPWLTQLMAVWPILGSMFMFRLILYVYDRRTIKAPARWEESLAYFFMLPNLCFPLFPVVDYKTFLSSQKTGHDPAVHLRGAKWIVRGLVQLLLYKLVYQTLQLDELDVKSVGQIAHYMLAMYLLYLNVSGIFHVAIGMLCIFGFNLPETHHLYYLASSFTDYWRRINIYWKDFMSKVFYVPIFFRLRKMGPDRAMVISTLVVFLLTWLLHSYQWLWILGKFPLEARDGIFWGVLGVFVVYNSLLEARRGRQRSLGTRAWTLRSSFVLACKTTATFVVICILWSLWYSPSVGRWRAIFALPAESRWQGTQWVVLGLLGAVVVGTLVRWVTGRPRYQQAARRVPFWATAAAGFLTLGVVRWAGDPAVNLRFGPQVASLIADLQTDKLNAKDQARQEKGYYEALTGDASFGSQLWEVLNQRPSAWNDVVGETGPSEPVGGLLGWRLPKKTQILHKGRPFATNEFGMRDQDYTLVKPPGTYRIALLGSSHVLGSGVGNGENFESFLEERLNEECAGLGDYQRYEILNFAVVGYCPLQQVVVAEEVIAPFDPDAMFFIAHPNDGKRVVSYLAKFVRNKDDVGYEALNDVIQRAEVDASASVDEIEKQLSPYTDELLLWSYRNIQEACTESGWLPVWVFLERLDDPAGIPLIEYHFRMAEDAGFEYLLDLRDAYGGHDQDALKVAAYDAHPSVEGHRIVADVFFDALRELDRAHGLGILAPAPDAPDAAGARPSPEDQRN